MVRPPHTQRFDSDKAGDREVQRTMLELLSQMDGFTASDNIKVRLFLTLLPCFLSRPGLLTQQVIAATNRVDILDPALLRSGRLDRKIEFPLPNEDARARIMQIHSRKMNVQCALSPSLTPAPTSTSRSSRDAQRTSMARSSRLCASRRCGYSSNARVLTRRA